MAIRAVRIRAVRIRAVRLVAVMAGLAALGFATKAQATPLTYFFTGGSVTITATVQGDQVAGPVTVPLTGISVTADTSALTLDEIDFSAGASGAVTISPSYLGYESITLNFALANAVGGSLTLVDPGPPAEYGFSINDLTVSGEFDASGTSVPTLTDEYFGFVTPIASGTIFIDPVTGTLELDGITLGEIQPDGAPYPLVLKGDFVFTGVVPEPGTALLVLTGILGLGAAGRRRAA
jgi:hypothetical protein